MVSKSLTLVPSIALVGTSDLATITSILCKGKDDRTPADIDMLEQYCTRFRFFESFSSDVVREFLSLAEYSRLRQNEILLDDKAITKEPFDAGISVILSGTVEMRIMTPISRFAIDLTKGEAVGEPHLIRNLPPNTYYVAKENVEILRIPQSTFDAHSDVAEEKDLANRIQFLREQPIVPLFTNVSDEEIAVVARSLYTLRFPSRYVIVKEKEVGAEMFFIRSGECRVVREIEFTSGNTTSVKLMELATLVPGEYFGELALLNYDITVNTKYRKRKDSGGKQGQGADNPTANNKISSLPDDDMFAEETVTEDNAHRSAPTAPLSVGCDPTVMPRQATVFSHTIVEVYVLPGADLKRQLPRVTYQRMEEYAKGYPSSQEVRTHFRRQNKWRQYKQSVLNEVFGPYTRHTASQSMADSDDFL